MTDYLQASVTSILNDGPSDNNDLLALFVIEKVHGFSIDPASFTVKEFVAGTGLYQGIRFPAGIATVSLREVNGVERTRRDLCFIFAGLDDAEYGYWRSIKTFDCGGADYSAIEEWKRGASFTPNAQ